MTGVPLSGERPQPKALLSRGLRQAQEPLPWKLDGLSAP